MELMNKVHLKITLIRSTQESRFKTLWSMTGTDLEMIASLSIEKNTSGHLAWLMRFFNVKVINTIDEHTSKNTKEHSKVEFFGLIK